MTVIEALVLGAVGTVAVWKALRHLAPALIVALQGRVAVLLARPGSPSLLRRYGLWLRPVAAAKPASGCGSGCSACAGCASAAPQSDVQPLVFRRIEPPLPRG